MKRRRKILSAALVGLFLMAAILGIWLMGAHHESKNEVEIFKDALRAKGEKLKLAEVLPQNARIDRGHDRLHLTAAVILDVEFVEALVAATETEDGKMRDVAHGEWDVWEVERN